MDDDPFNVAALRTRQSVAPPGGRKEGAATDYLVQMGENTKRQMEELASDLIKNPANIVGTGELSAAVPVLGSIMRDTLYHGSPTAGLSVLRESPRGALGPGVYATPTKELGQLYRRGTGELYEFPNKDRDIYRGLGHRNDEEWYGFKDDKERLLAAIEPERRAELEEILSHMWSADGYQTYGRIAQMYRDEGAATNLFKRAGFEGLSGVADGHEVVLFGDQPLKNALGPGALNQLGVK